MPQITGALPLNDGLATPVARSFVPQMIGSDHSRFAYKVSTIKPTWVTFDVKWSDSTPKRPTVRQELATELPIVRVINAVPTRISTARAITTYVIPDDMTEAEAKDLRAFHISGLSHSAVAVGITIREPFWG